MTTGPSSRAEAVPAAIAVAVGATRPAFGRPLMAAAALHAHRHQNPHR